MIEKIVSGGQTGVDQAALSIATHIGLTVGGWCPKGGLDENNKNILEKFPTLSETASENPAVRTKLNIDDSDGTLIIVPILPLPKEINDGTVLTIDYARELNKHCLIINLAEQHDIQNIILDWINRNNIRILNIAGPRESKSPGIFEKSCDLFKTVFPLFLHAMKPRL